MSSSSAVGGSSMWYLTASCGMSPLTLSLTLVSGFSRRLKYFLYLSIIFCFSMWSTLLSILFTGSKWAPYGPYTSLSDAKNALGLFRSARYCISDGLSVYQSFFICCSFFWSSDFTPLYLFFVALVHPPACVLWKSELFLSTNSINSSFNSLNQSACFLVGLLRTSEAAL